MPLWSSFKTRVHTKTPGPWLGYHGQVWDCCFWVSLLDICYPLFLNESMIATFPLLSTWNILQLGSERPEANTPHYLRPGWSDSCLWDMYSRQHFVVIPGAETALPDILKRKAQRANPNIGAHIHGQKIPFCLLEVSWRWWLKCLWVGSLYTACLWSMSVLPLVDIFSGYLPPHPLLNQMSFWGVGFDSG